MVFLTRLQCSQPIPCAAHLFLIDSVTHSFALRYECGFPDGLCQPEKILPTFRFYLQSGSVEETHVVGMCGCPIAGRSIGQIIPEIARAMDWFIRTVLHGSSGPATVGGADIPIVFIGPVNDEDIELKVSQLRKIRICILEVNVCKTVASE